MINQFLKDRLCKMAHTINELKVQREQIEAGFEEPDVCADCRYYTLEKSGTCWDCNLLKAPLSTLGRELEDAYKLCCIYFKSRKPKGGD